MRRAATIVSGTQDPGIPGAPPGMAAAVQPTYAPQQAYAPQQIFVPSAPAAATNLAPTTLTVPQGYAPSQVPQGYAPTTLTVPQGYAPTQVPQGYAPAQVPQGYAPTTLTVPQGYAPGQVPQSATPSVLLAGSQAQAPAPMNNNTGLPLQVQHRGQTIPTISAVGVSTILSEGYERLPQNPNGLSYPGMIRYATISDESSLLHAISTQLFLDYRTTTSNVGEVPFQVRATRERRNQLAEMLDKPHKAGDGKVTYYQSLDDGEIEKLGRTDKRFSLEGMKQKLLSKEHIGIEFLHYISSFYDVDIYVINLPTIDVHTLNINDYTLFYKSRKRSLVIGMIGNHFEAIGIEVGPNMTAACFKPTNPFVLAIRKRLGV